MARRLFCEADYKSHGYISGHAFLNILQDLNLEYSAQKLEDWSHFHDVDGSGTSSLKHLNYL